MRQPNMTIYCPCHMTKTMKKYLSLELIGQSTLVWVCIIRDMGLTNCVKMMIPD